MKLIRCSKNHSNKVKKGLRMNPQAFLLLYGYGSLVFAAYRSASVRNAILPSMMTSLAFSLWSARKTRTPLPFQRKE